MHITNYIGTVSRPSIVTPGYTFLTQPKYIVEKNLQITFNWEIKCVGTLQEITLEVLKISHGSGRNAKLHTQDFVIPEKMYFPETLKKPGHVSACLSVTYSLQVKNLSLPRGKYSLWISARSKEQTYVIFQVFTLVNKF